MNFEPKLHEWTDTGEHDVQWTWSLESDQSLLLANEVSDQRLRITQDGEFRFYGPGGLYVNDAQLPGQGIDVDADTLDGYTSSQFGVLSEAETATGVWNFANGVKSRGSFVLTRQDQTDGTIDAGTIDGLDVPGIRPDIQSGGTTIETNPTVLNFTGSISAVEQAGDTGVIDIDVEVPDAVSDSRVNIREEGTEVVHYATDLDFAGDHFDVTNPSGTTAGVALTNPGVDVQDSGTAELADGTTLNFADHLTVAVTGSTATIDVDFTAQATPKDILGVDTLGFSGGGDNLGTIQTPDAADGALRVWNAQTGATFLRWTAANEHEQFVPIRLRDAGDGLEYGSRSGGQYYRYVPYRDTLGGLSNSGNLPYAAGTTLETDTLLALVESDADRVMGWFSSATNSLTIEKIRTGDLGGAPSEALDVRGNLTLNGGQLKAARIENRTSDPQNPEVGRLWLRTDV